jgi:alcohol dehydrogenase class IV
VPETNNDEAEALDLGDEIVLGGLPKSVDDDPARAREFLEFRKVMAGMNTGTATVGSILGAMVYQIGEMRE